MLTSIVRKKDSDIYVQTFNRIIIKGEKKMKKLVLFAIIGAVLTATVFSQNKTVKWDGTTYQIVTQAKDFLIAYRDSKPAALLFKINDYQKTMFSIRDEAAKLNIDMTQVFSPSVIVRASTLELYSMLDAFSLIQGGTVTPNVDAYVFTKVKQVSGNVSRTETANNLKAYFKYLADLWWPLRNRYDTESSYSGTPGARICDSCYKDVLYGTGYIYGYYANGNLSAYRLWCNNCMEENLDKYRKNGLSNEGGYFEESDVRRANDYAKERR